MNTIFFSKNKIKFKMKHNNDNYNKEYYYMK